MESTTISLVQSSWVHGITLHSFRFANDFSTRKMQNMQMKSSALQAWDSTS